MQIMAPQSSGQPSPPATHLITAPISNVSLHVDSPAADAAVAPSHQAGHNGQARPYTTFTRRQRAFLVLMASLAASFSGFASNIFFPAIPTMAAALHTSIENINLSVTTYMIFQAISPTFWG